MYIYFIYEKQKKEVYEVNDFICARRTNLMTRNWGNFSGNSVCLNSMINEIAIIELKKQIKEMNDKINNLIKSNEELKEECKKHFRNNTPILNLRQFNNDDTDNENNWIVLND